MPLSNDSCVGPEPLCSERLQTLATDELARLAQAGDADAFAAMVPQLRPRLLVVLTKRMHGRFADAEDVAQDTLTRAWQHIRSYDCDRPFTAWVYTIAFRRATDFLRSKRRRLRHTQQLPAQDTNPATPSATESASTVQEAADNIWAVAKQVLSATQYSALWLRYAEELPVNEIAATIGKTEVATRVLLCRARLRIQTQLAGEGESDE